MQFFHNFKNLLMYELTFKKKFYLDIKKERVVGHITMGKLKCNQVSLKQKMLYYCKSIIFYFLNHISIYQISCTRLRDFQYDTYKYAMNRVDCDVIALWKNYRPRHVTSDNYDKFQEFMTSNEFRRRLRSKSKTKIEKLMLKKSQVLSWLWILVCQTCS